MSSTLRVAIDSMPIGVSGKSSTGSTLKASPNWPLSLMIACRNALWIGSAAFSTIWSQLHGTVILNGAMVMSG